MADKSEKEEVEMVMRQMSVCPHTRQEDTLWEIKIDIKYEDYAVLQQSIRVLPYLFRTICSISLVLSSTSKSPNNRVSYNLTTKFSLL